MIIESVTFVGSATGLDRCPNRPLAEIAVSGRSNVGKSSLLNSLLGRRHLARVSSTPGKTQLLQYFLVNERFHVVDLPGYGYSRAPASVRAQWSRMMQDYLRRREQLEGVLQLVDCRHAPSEQDIAMVRWLVAEAMPFCLVATKMDKLRRGERAGALGRIVAALDLPADQPMVPHSSQTSEGRDALLDWIDGVLQN